MRAWILVCSFLLFGSFTKAQQPIIYDDDCSQDVDCVSTLPILYALEDRGDIKILAMVANSANPLSAPVMKVFANYGGHPQTVISANQSDDPSTTLCSKEKCNESDWTAGLIARFDAGDSRRNYPSCVAVYRKALANQPKKSVAIVATGFATCLNQLLASGPDAISQLSGADLVKQKVKLLSVMGGKYPSGTEWNFECDAPGFHKLFALWTLQNGFPPVYLNGFANGLDVLAGPPATASPMVNPTKYGLDLAKTSQRPMWDMLSALFAARGLAYKGTTYFRLSAPGTVVVDAATGDDVWASRTNSGHYVLTNAASNETLSALFDGYTHGSGFLAHEASAIKH
jgi:hypothetical protein